MYSGAPLVTSHAEGCRETAGDAALYARYDDPKDIEAQIGRLLDDPQLARELSVRGARRAHLFSWDAATAVIAGELARIAAIKPRVRRGTGVA
jgi:glycosyltransferase involved in cell wall biosynthesis